MYVVIATPSFTKHSLTESFRILPISNISLLKLIFAHGTMGPKCVGGLMFHRFYEKEIEQLWDPVIYQPEDDHWPGRAYKFGKGWKRS